MCVALFREKILTNGSNMSTLRYYISLLDLLAACAEVHYVIVTIIIVVIILLLSSCFQEASPPPLLFCSIFRRNTRRLLRHCFSCFLEQKMFLKSLNPSCFLGENVFSLILTPSYPPSRKKSVFVYLFFHGENMFTTILKPSHYASMGRTRSS